MIAARTVTHMSPRHFTALFGTVALVMAIFASIPLTAHAQYPGGVEARAERQRQRQEEIAANECHRMGTADGPCAKGQCPREAGAECTAVACNSAVDCRALDIVPTGGSVNPEFVFKPVNAVLQIPIPNLQFSNILNNVRSVDGTTDVVSIPWIGEYIAAIYRWSIPVGAVLAVIMIMIGGILWLTSAGAERLSTAKTWITNAVIGLLLLVCSYVILNIINPDLVNLTQLSIRITRPEKIVFTDEPDAIEPVEGAVPASIVTLTGDDENNIGGSTQIDQPLLQDVLNAAQELKRLHVQLYVTSSYRTEAKQRQLIKEYCQNPPGSDRCNPKPGKPVVCMLRKGIESCPHTTGHAVDAWGVVNGRKCIDQPKCLENPSACRADPCQSLVIEAMRSQGFCNWPPEPWHFEKPGMSKPCN